MTGTSATGGRRSLLGAALCRRRRTWPRAPGRGSRAVCASPTTSPAGAISSSATCTCPSRCSTRWPATRSGSRRRRPSDDSPQHPSRSMIQRPTGGRRSPPLTHRVPGAGCAPTPASVAGARTRPAKCTSRGSAGTSRPSTRAATTCAACAPTPVWPAATRGGHPRRGAPRGGARRPLQHPRHRLGPLLRRAN